MIEKEIEMYMKKEKGAIKRKKRKWQINLTGTGL